MATIIHRNDSAAQWAMVNPVLAEGEPAYETDTGLQKIGDGHTHWNDLQYFGGNLDDVVSHEELNDHIVSPAPHPAYDDGPSFQLLYENAKV